MTGASELIPGQFAAQRNQGRYVVLSSPRGKTPFDFHDLIEIGIDILEAVQAECMDLTGLKREFGRDITFWGGVGAQSVLARATAEQVTEGVRQTLRTMAVGGGYIAAPCYTLTEEVPWSSIATFHEAVTKFGAYPRPGQG